jgi:RHS repeat-associated protein
VNSSQGLAAAYRYDPYGRLMGSSGTLAAANVYRFSSKELHAKSGMYGYGFRFYDPTLQRWLNRDPIFEAGGINLYGFVGNNPLTSIDPFGLDEIDDWLGLPPGGGYRAGCLTDNNFTNPVTGESRTGGQLAGDIGLAVGEGVGSAAIAGPISKALGKAAGRIGGLLKRKPARDPFHHIFPQRPDLARRFEQIGINVDDFTMQIPKPLHDRIHGGRLGGPWNKAWDKFFVANPRATAEDCYKEAGRLIYQFQLPGGPVVRYPRYL